MSKKLRYLMSAAIAASVVPIGAPAVMAQGIEEIIVVARKREESLQKVPVAVTAFSGVQLEKQNFKDLGNLGALTPGLAVSQPSQGSPGGFNFSLRGQTAADLLLTIDPAVSLYLNGAVLPHGYGLSSNVFDIERVEVLKGPQGTLYGKNTTGGAINVISKAPNYDGIHGYAGIDVGNYGNLDWKGAVNIPFVNDALAVRLAFQRSYRNGFGVQTGESFDLNGAAPGGVQVGTQKLGNDDEWAFRGSLLFEPMDDVRIDIVGDYLRVRENNLPVKMLGWLLPSTIAPSAPEGTRQVVSELFGIPFAAATPAQLAAANDFMRNTLAGRGGFTDIYSGSLPSFANTDVWGISGTVTIDVAENVELKSISSFRRFSDERLSEIDGGPFIIHDSPLEAGGDSFTQEVNVSGTGMEGKLDWIAGAFYSTESGTDNSDSTARPAASGLAHTFIQGWVDNRSWAAYSQLSYDLLDNLSVTVGGRYTDEQRELRTRNHGRLTAYNPITKVTTDLPIFICGTISPVAAAFNPANFKFNAAGCELTLPPLTAEGFSWLGSVDYEVTDDVMVYAKVSRGSRSGGYNLRGFFSPNFDPTEPENAREIEVGLKGDFFQNRLRTNIAAFTTKYTDRQESFLNLTPAGLQTVIQNAARAKIEGVEAEVFANPFENFNLSGTMGYLKPTYKEFAALDPNGGGLGVLGVFDRAGQEFAYNRKWSYSVQGSYDWQTSFFNLGPAVITPTATWYWSSEAAVEPLSMQVLAAPLQPELGVVDQRNREARGKLNVRVAMDLPDWGTNVAFYGTNILNEEYYYVGTGVASRQYIASIAEEPRFWGFQVTQRFGNE